MRSTLLVTTRRGLASALLAALLTGASGGAAAASDGAPTRLGPITQTYTAVGFNCPGFDIQIAGTDTEDFTFWSDGNGNLARALHRVRAPHDTLTNTVTGKSIVVRGEFQETVVPIPGTDEATKTITGFRYMVDQPGTGVTIRDVGRILYGDLEQTVELWEAGKHDLVFDSQFDGVFCAALA